MAQDSVRAAIDGHSLREKSGQARSRDESHSENEEGVLQQGGGSHNSSSLSSFDWIQLSTDMENVSSQLLPIVQALASGAAYVATVDQGAIIAAAMDMQVLRDGRLAWTKEAGSNPNWDTAAESDVDTNEPAVSPEF